MRRLLSLGLILFTAPLFATSLLATPSFAADLQSDLDLSAVYGGLNAGLYRVEINFLPVNANVEGLYSANPVDKDGDRLCLAVLQYDLGKVQYTLIAASGTRTTIEKTMTGYLRAQGELCATAAELLWAAGSLSIDLGQASFTLPVTAPQGYASVNLGVAPSYLAYNQHGAASLNPAQIMTPALGQSPSLLLTYILTAATADKQTNLSLAVGNVPLAIALRESR